MELGEKFSIKPTVQGDGLTYQWYVKEAGAKAFKVSSHQRSRPTFPSYCLDGN